MRRIRNTILKVGFTKALHKRAATRTLPVIRIEGGHSKDRGGERRTLLNLNPILRWRTAMCVSGTETPLCPLQLRKSWSAFAECQRSVSKSRGNLTSASGPEKTGAIVYALGWTQHSKGCRSFVSLNSAIAVGNIGRPGGGILALRGHASIQGSTDIPRSMTFCRATYQCPRSRGLHKLKGSLRNTLRDRAVGEF